MDIELKENVLTETLREYILKYFDGDEMATDVFLRKYSDNGEAPDDMHWRMAEEFARIEEEYQKDEKRPDSLSEYGKERTDLTKEKIYRFFKNFKYIIPQGSVMATLGTDIIASLSNCFVSESPLDSYAAIHKADGDLIFYYKRRGGVGNDISNLRPKGTSTNNVSKSSTGAVSFMERFSNTTREVGMNGRRGALMLSIDVNHPDVEDFATIKSDREKVTGANVSIKLNKEFMDAVENDEDYILKFPCDTDLSKCHISKNDVNYNKLEQCTNKYGDKVYVKKVKAKELWETVTHQAREHSEPGLMFWDRVIDYDPAGVYDEYKPETSNPCGEQFLQPNDSCRLMAHNLYSYVDNPFSEDAKFDYDKFYKYCYEGLRLGDDLIDLEAEYIDRIIEKIKSDPEPHRIKRQELELWQKTKEVALEGRRIGMGITALGDMLAALGLDYDSEEGISMAASVMYCKMGAELDASTDLSIQRGSFDNYDKNKEFVSKMDSHGVPVSGKNDFYDSLIANFPEEAERMYKYGRRNVNWSTIAPCGSVSILTQTTSGCEPLFKGMYKRRRKINPDESNAQIDYTDDSGDDWQEYFVLHNKFEDWIKEHGLKYYKESEVGKLPKNLSKDTLETMFKNSPWSGSEANDIDWIKRVEMQKVLQKFTSNSISSTLNLPEDVSNEEVEEIYREGYEKGLKGVTIYREGSRSGVLVSDEEETVKDRPQTLNCHIYHNQAGGDKFTTIIGLMYGKPYEIFCIPGYVASNYDKGMMTKVESGQYRLDTAPDESYGVFEDVTNKMPGVIKNLCIAWSYCLRYGTPIEKLVDKIGLVEEPINSFPKVVQRNLKPYIDDGTESTQSCPECGEDTLIYQEGCKQCINPECGWSAC